MTNLSKNKILPLDIDEDERVCDICLSPLSKKKTLVLDCLHEYHIDCIDEWLCNTENCPHCRSNQEDAVLLLNNIRIIKERKSLKYRVSYFKNFFCFDAINFCRLGSVRYRI